MENKKEGKIKESLKAGGLLSLLIIGVIISSVYLTSVDDIIEKQTILAIRTPFLVTGDANPGDNSGFFYFMVYPHQADPGTAYASNLSNATAYEYSDSGNVSATGETPYSTTFDIVLKVGVTNEDGQWSSNNTWNDGYMWMLLTCSDLSIGADTNMTEIEIGNTSSYRWMHYYLDNTGSGYTIVEAQSFNVTSVKFYIQRIV